MSEQEERKHEKDEEHRIQAQQEEEPTRQQNEYFKKQQDKGTNLLATITSSYITRRQCYRRRKCFAVNTINIIMRIGGYTSVSIILLLLLTTIITPIYTFQIIVPIRYLCYNTKFRYINNNNNNNNHCYNRIHNNADAPKRPLLQRLEDVTHRNSFDQVQNNNTLNGIIPNNNNINNDDNDGIVAESNTIGIDDASHNDYENESNKIILSSVIDLKDSDLTTEIIIQSANPIVQNAQRIDDPFWIAMKNELQYTVEQQEKIWDELLSAGLVSSTSSHVLFTIVYDYLTTSANSDIISTILIQDFRITPLVAHQTRTILNRCIGMTNNQEEQQQQLKETEDARKLGSRYTKINNNNNNNVQQQQPPSVNGLVSSSSKNDIQQQQQRRFRKRSNYKETIVSEKASHRRQRTRSVNNSTTSDNNNGNQIIETNNHQQSTVGNMNLIHNYGLKFTDIETRDKYPVLDKEIHDFYKFMTIPSTSSQGESILRHATANIYLRHAQLFIGWYIHYQEIQRQQQHDQATMDYTNHLSINTIIPTREKESANPIIDYIVWLRSNRQISVSYEANLLRGLIKLFKFRFRNESLSTTTSSSTSDRILPLSSSTNAIMRSISTKGVGISFADIPVVEEIRKLHRVANKDQAIAPRCSNEEKKWLSWTDYLSVVQCLKRDVEQYITEYTEYVNNQETKDNPDDAHGIDRRMKSRNKMSTTNRMEKRIAVALQEYLMLAFFAHIPDRQRTIRELQYGVSFVRVQDTQNPGQQQVQWCIKHTPEMYKTGRTYGERPPMHLPVSLTPAIDDYWYRWRSCLLPKDPTQHHNYFFVQTRTGKPVTENTVYTNVVKACYQYMGKRTNPHLLRDMIVTHVRGDTQQSVTEQQLEALALYMGHSIQIQRKSYDRRTLSKKVAPAIELLQSINTGHLLSS